MRSSINIIPHSILTASLTLASLAHAASTPSETALARSDIVNLDPLVVTGTRTAQRLSEVPVRTEIVGNTEINAMQSRNLADAIGFVPGVRVENNCQNCNFSQIRLLGLEGAYSQILIDGQPLVSSLASVYAVEQIPTSLLERIEIVKGGGSALYGPGSIGGIVNLIPRTPTESRLIFRMAVEDMEGTNTSTKSPKIGSSTGLQADAVSSGGHHALTAYWQGDRELAKDLSGDGYTEVGFKELSAGGIRYVYTPKRTEARLAIDAGRSFENRRGGNLVDLPEHESDVAESIQALRDFISLSWSHKINDTFDYRLATSYAKTERDSYYGSGRDPNAYGHTDNTLSVYDAQFNHRLGSHVFTWGAQHHSEELNDVQPAYSRQTDARYRNTGVMVQDEWQVANDWELLVGARLDENNQIADRVLSPRAALRWRQNENLTWRLGVATGFRSPQVFDEDLHITQVAGEGQIIKNDPNLAEESAHTTTFGIEWMKPVGNANWMVDINTFHTDISDSFTLEEDTSAAEGNESVLIRRNGSGALIYGVEANLGVTLGRKLTIQIGYVEQRSRYDEAISPLEGTSSRRFQRTPDRYGTATLDAALPFWELRVFAGATLTGPMEVPHAAPDPADIPADYPYSYITENRIERSPWFFTLDFNFSREFEFGGKSGRHHDVTVRVGVKNLTDDRQTDFDQGEFRDSGYIYGPRLPRRFYVSTEWKF